MNNSEIEHIIRACVGITGEESVIIIGSQAILASFSATELPETVTRSIEADVLFLDDPNQRLADLIDGSIGELSLFHDSFGIYAQGVDESTAILPSGWKQRLVKLSNENTGGGMGLCLDPYDLCVAKLCAYREKDLDYVASLLTHEIIKKDLLEQRLEMLEGFALQRHQAVQFLSSF
jgi:hypothetical protein